MTRPLTRGALALVLAAGVLAGCARSDADPDTNADPSPDVTTNTTTESADPQAIPFELYTHCGIDEARVGSTYYEAVDPLSDGSGNPPEGWDNPVQQGWMTVVSDTRAVFTDDAGHEVEFRARPDATSFKTICD